MIKSLKIKTLIEKLKSRIAKLNGIPDRLESIESRLDSLEARVSSPEEREAAVRSSALLAAGWIARSNALRSRIHYPETADVPIFVGPTITEAWEKLEALKPNIFPVWKQLYENAENSYTELVEASYSHWDHKYGRLFGAFVSLFAHGRLLDIGCGANGLPSYLAGYSCELIYGLDPGPLHTPVDFTYVQGFNEFLPWKDNSFNTVVSGTSLDHVLSLEKTFDEIKRVLTSDGRYLVWLASIPGAKPYEPDSEAFEPADEFHLFHFDRKWIEPLFDRYFSIEEVCVISQPGFDHVFYCLANRSD